MIGDPYKNLDKHPWLLGAPDEESKMAAVRVLIYQMNAWPNDTEAYLKQTYGISSNQAKDTMKACGKGDPWWRRLWSWFIGARG